MVPRVEGFVELLCGGCETFLLKPHDHPEQRPEISTLPHVSASFWSLTLFLLKPVPGNTRFGIDNGITSKTNGGFRLREGHSLLSF